MKLREIAGKSEKDLRELLLEKRQELFKLNLDNKQNKLKNTRSIYNSRKEIARILTLIREKGLAAPVVEKETNERLATTETKKGVGV